MNQYQEKNPIQKAAAARKRSNLQLSRSIFIGTAGWTIPAAYRENFPAEGTHLSRYANVFNGVEINSSFYRDHKPATYEKWAQSVPDEFRFSVKLSRYFTQYTHLKETGAKLKSTLSDISELGKKFDVLLVQLPPSLKFDEKDAKKFMAALRKSFSGHIAWEPRHQSWQSATKLFREFEVTKVSADPERCDIAEEDLGQKSFQYFRLHGSPEIYKSPYDQAYLQKVAEDLQTSKQAWCVFDNTTFGYATKNALELKKSIISGK